MKTDELISKIDKYLQSEDFEKYIKNIQNKRIISSKQIERARKKLLDKNYFSNVIAKISKKYESNIYCSRWYKRGITPPKTLYFFLFSLAEKHGTICNSREWRKYANCFTESLIYYKGFYFQKMNGQGTVIKIHKK